MSELSWTGVSYPLRIENGSMAISHSVVGGNTDKSPHLSESINQIIHTNLGEWFTANHIGTNFRSLVFSNFSMAYAPYICSRLVQAIETEDTRIRVTNIAIKKEQDKNTLRVRVAWSINPNIIQNGGSYHDEFSYPLNDVEVSEE